jgi:uncharacterized membrane protein
MEILPVAVFALFFVLVLVFMVITVIRRSKKRAIVPHELKHVPIAPYYSIPDNLPPAQVGYLENRIFDASDFTAIIIDLAVRGFLKIKYISKEGIFGRDDYELSSLKPYDENLPPEYRSVYDLFFGDGGTVTRVNSVERYIGAAKLREAGLLVAKGFDDAGCLIKPKIGMVGKAAVVFFLAAVASLYLFHDAFFVFAPLMVISIFIAAGQYKQKFTPQGIELMRKVLGFKMFLTLTETDRMKLMDAPKTSQESFDAILPYAIALGVEKEWAKQFESMTIQPPQWIDDPRYRTGFNAGMFVTSFSSFTSAMRSSTMMAGSGAGGGGGVGGGGGGGGGGSW